MATGRLPRECLGGRPRAREARAWSETKGLFRGDIRGDIAGGGGVVAGSRAGAAQSFMTAEEAPEAAVSSAAEPARGASWGL